MRHNKVLKKVPPELTYISDLAFYACEGMKSPDLHVYLLADGYINFLFSFFSECRCVRVCIFFMYRFLATFFIQSASEPVRWAENHEETSPLFDYAFGDVTGGIYA